MRYADPLAQAEIDRLRAKAEDMERLDARLSHRLLSSRKLSKQQIREDCDECKGWGWVDTPGNICKSCGNQIEPQPGPPKRLSYWRSGQRIVVDVDREGLVRASEKVIDWLLTDAGFTLEPGG